MLDKRREARSDGPVLRSFRHNHFDLANWPDVIIDVMRFEPLPRGVTNPDLQYNRIDTIRAIEATEPANTTMRIDTSA